MITVEAVGVNCMRTFIAIDLDKQIRQRLGDAQDRLRGECAGVKWVKPDNMHLTLKFLGEIADQQVEPVTHSLNDVAQQCSPFDIEIAGAGVFGDRGPVRVIWIGVRDSAGKLAHCQQLCEQLLEPHGFERERRPYSPHLTLARNRDRGNDKSIRAAVKQVDDYRAGTQHVTGLTFYQSTLTSRGPIYQPVSQHPFGA